MRLSSVIQLGSPGPSQRDPLATQSARVSLRSNQAARPSLFRNRPGSQSKEYSTPVPTNTPLKVCPGTTMPVKRAVVSSNVKHVGVGKVSLSEARVDVGQDVRCH